MRAHIRIGLDLGNSLDQRERKSANTQVTKLQKKSVQLPSKSKQSVIFCDCLWNILFYLIDRLPCQLYPSTVPKQ